MSLEEIDSLTAYKGRTTNLVEKIKVLDFLIAKTETLLDSNINADQKSFRRKLLEGYKNEQRDLIVTRIMELNEKLEAAPNMKMTKELRKLTEQYDTYYSDNSDPKQRSVSMNTTTSDPGVNTTAKWNALNARVNVQVPYHRSTNKTGGRRIRKTRRYRR